MLRSATIVIFMSDAVANEDTAYRCLVRTCVTHPPVIMITGIETNVHYEAEVLLPKTYKNRNLQVALRSIK